MLSTYYLQEYKNLKLDSICKAPCKVIGKKEAKITNKCKLICSHLNLTLSALNTF